MSRLGRDIRGKKIITLSKVTDRFWNVASISQLKCIQGSIESLNSA